MATHEDIENLTVEEFMDGLDYAVKKKKHKLITKLKKEADKKYPNAKKEDIQYDDYIITEEDKNEIKEVMSKKKKPKNLRS